MYTIHLEKRPRRFVIDRISVDGWMNNAVLTLSPQSFAHPPRAASSLSLRTFPSAQLQDNINDDQRNNQIPLAATAPSVDRYIVYIHFTLFPNACICVRL